MSEQREPGEGRQGEEIDAAYLAVYDEHPIDEADEWGDLASFRGAIGRVPDAR